MGLEIWPLNELTTKDWPLFIATKFLYWCCFYIGINNPTNSINPLAFFYIGFGREIKLSWLVKGGKWMLLRLSRSCWLASSHVYYLSIFQKHTSKLKVNLTFGYTF